MLRLKSRCLLGPGAFSYLFFSFHISLSPCNLPAHEIVLVFIHILVMNTLTAESSIAMRMLIRAEHQIMTSNVGKKKHREEKIRSIFSIPFCLHVFLLLWVRATQAQPREPKKKKRKKVGICNQPLSL